MAGLSFHTYGPSRMRALRDAFAYDPDGYKARVKQMWSKRAPQYDFKNEFHPPLCEQLVSLAGLTGQSLRVLDVATGTGTVAMSAARALGPSGSVTAVDLSEAMLTQAGLVCRTGRGSHVLYSTEMPYDLTDETCVDVSDCGFMSAGNSHKSLVQLRRRCRDVRHRQPSRALALALAIVYCNVTRQE